jgi:primosomal protein N' (replication factor Y)
MDFYKILKTLNSAQSSWQISLAIILGIDSIFNQSTFRARELALSLSIQIAGRSGRSKWGKAIIQTKNIDFFKKYINDYELFLKDELLLRKDFYPPFIKLTKVTFFHTNFQIAKNELNQAINLLNNFPIIELIGTKEADIFKLNNKYRYEMLLRSNNLKKLLNFLHLIKGKNNVIDIDTLR